MARKPRVEYEGAFYHVIVRGNQQRFLGDEHFIGQIAERAPKREIKLTARKLRFEKLLPAVAQVHGCGVSDLTAAGRQRAWAKPRAQLAYLARDWCAMKAIEIARRLHRGASMVSRLCASYEGVRDASTEKKSAELIAVSHDWPDPIDRRRLFMTYILDRRMFFPFCGSAGHPNMACRAISRSGRVTPVFTLPLIFFIFSRQTKAPCPEDRAATSMNAG